MVPNYTASGLTGQKNCTCRTLFGTFLRKPNKSIEGKTEISGGKSNVKRHTVWEASEKLGCD